MEMVILVIHIILALAIICTILLQPPENSSLGGLGASNMMAGSSGRSQGNLLTRTTAILATCFIITSMILAIIAGHHNTNASILDNTTASAPADAAKADKVDEAVQKKTEEPVKTAPSVPLTQ